MIRNLKLSTKMIIGFSIIAVLCLIVGIFGLTGLSSMYSASQDMYSNNVTPIIHVSHSVSSFSKEVSELNRLFSLIEEPALHREIIAQIEIYSNEFNSNLSAYAATVQPSSAQEMEMLSQASELASRFSVQKKALIDAVTSGNVAAATAASRQIDLSVLQFFDLTDVAVNANNTNISEHIDFNAGLYGSVRLFILLALFAAIFSSVFLGIYNARLIARPAVEMLEVAKKLSVGDIDVKVEASSRDEIGQLGDAFSELIKSIRAQSGTLEALASGDFSGSCALRSEKDIMGNSIEKIHSELNDAFEEILLSTQQVSNGSRQIAEGSQSLAQGATEQAASVEELSASINQITLQTQENTRKAERASSLSSQIKENATTGMSNMKDMLHAVDKINDASKQISRVIKVIDDIAFQTNILALNAAVEAARAGQHGKGFAVVAEEVRSLASRSADAAKETTTLIENSISKADEGRRIATVTAKNLDDIVNGVMENTGIISEIAISSQEQSMAISQINIGIEQVSQVVQANSATAEESAAASEEMSSQASVLASLIGRFTLRNPSPGRHAPFHAPLQRPSARKKQLSMPPVKPRAKTPHLLDSSSATHTYYHPEDVAESGFGKY